MNQKFAWSLALAFELESLVTHLFMVNGRVLNAVPPGSLIEVAPKKAARGREADTILILMTPSGDIASADTYKKWARLASERYFNSTGSVTTGLRAVYDAINKAIMNQNRIELRQYEVNFICGVLHDSSLFLSRCGLALGIVYYQKQLSLFPTDPLDDTAMVFGAPLGVVEIPDVRIKRFEVEAGSRLILSDSELADVAHDKLASVFQVRDVNAMMAHVKNLVIDRATAMGVEFITPGTLPNLHVNPGSNSLDILESPISPEKQLEQVNLAPALGTQLINFASDLRDQTQVQVSKASAGIARGAKLANQANEHYFGQPEAEPEKRAVTLTILATLIPVLVVVLVVVFWLLNVDRSNYEQCVVDTLSVATIARNIDSSDVQGTLSGWNAVLEKSAECEQMRPEGIPESTLTDLQSEGQAIIDRLLNISRRQNFALTSFPSAQLTRVELRGLNMYVLDGANDIVYELTLSSDGRSVVPGTQSPIPNMRRNAPVNQYIIGEIIDIAWADDGNALSQGNVLVALDRNGVLVEHSPTILSRGVQKLIGVENWGNPIAARLWRGNLYLLDPTANQIWRYEPINGSYSGTPSEYFTGQLRPNIANAKDFSIDANGALYILYSDGQMGKYVSGQAQTFGFANFPPGQELRTADAMYLSTSPIYQGLYIASRNNRTIYETTFAGTFIRSYRIYNEADFASLNNVIAEPAQQIIYALSGNTVFAFNREG